MPVGIRVTFAVPLMGIARRPSEYQVCIANAYTTAVRTFKGVDTVSNQPVCIPYGQSPRDAVHKLLEMFEPLQYSTFSARPLVVLIVGRVTDGDVLAINALAGSLHKWLDGFLVVVRTDNSWDQDPDLNLDDCLLITTDADDQESVIDTLVNRWEGLLKTD